ncbi:hypothetical protein FHS54_000401 [Sphingobium vermicomposti]|uniref:Uncharacterized protein n=2 Tax=Sphingobium vermicomposti TaxID=529005 RepID=A0A846M0K5_9SPHN|nr:hypothetical protein [Sphingobium vermicomposti]
MMTQNLRERRYSDADEIGYHALIRSSPHPRLREHLYTLQVHASLIGMRACSSHLVKSSRLLNPIVKSDLARALASRETRVENIDPDMLVGKRFTYMKIFGAVMSEGIMARDGAIEDIPSDNERYWNIAGDSLQFFRSDRSLTSEYSVMIRKSDADYIIGYFKKTMVSHILRFSHGIA